MSEQALKRLVGVLVVVTGLWVVAELVSNGSGSIAASGEMARFFEEVEASGLEAVEIVSQGDTIALWRAESGWAVNGFPADSAVVERFLAEIAEAEVGDLAATNPANHARMGVSADNAAEVRFVAEEDDRTLLVGDAGRRFGTVYARLPGEDRVYLVEADLRTHVRRALDPWRDRVMVSVDSAAVARIEVERDGGAYALVRGDSLWTVEGDGEASQTAVRGILSELSRMVASGFVAEGDSIGALPPASTTRAFTADGELLAEVTVGEGSGDRWARSTRTDYVYRVSAFRAGRVAPSPEDVEPEE